MSEILRALSDLCIQAYQQLISITEKRLQNIIGAATTQTTWIMLMFSPPLLLFTYLLPPFPLSVPALLESEAIRFSGSPSKLVTSRKRANSDPRGVAGDAPTMASVLRELGALHTALTRQALPTTQMEQVFHHLTYLIAASALNSLLLRKDVCSCSRGMQIR